MSGFVARALASIAALGLMLSLMACGSDAAKDTEQDAGPADAGPIVPPLELGEAIEAPANEWTWVDFPETRCMNDTPTGLGIKLVPGSDKAIVVIQGGGACFNPTTCFQVANPEGFGATEFDSFQTFGLLDDKDADNPFADWNMVFIPYCSGDIFSGSAKDKTGYEGRTQMGYLNVQEYLKRLVPTFADMEHVVLSGFSAGGFAASVNWVQTREAFGKNVRVDVLNDSGPTMGPDYLTPCLQKRLSEVWNWAPSIPPGCKDCDLETGNITEPVVRWSIEHTKDGRHGVISSDEDAIIKLFYGFGLNDCAQLDSAFATFPTGLYAEGLADLREQFADHPGAAMYVVRSNSHVWTAQSPGKVESAGVVLRDWILDFLDPEADFVDVVP